MVDFNAYEVEPASEGNVLLPPGNYVVRVLDTEFAANSKGTGSILKLTLVVDDGEFAGVKFLDVLNVEHQSPTAQNIGRARLSSLCRAIAAGLKTDNERQRVMVIKNGDFSVLADGVVVATVKNEEGKPYTDKETGEIKEGRPRNSVVRYAPHNGATPQPVVVPKHVNGAAPKATAKTSTPNW